MARRKEGAASPPSLRRSFVTPEGVDLRLELGGAGARAAAFLIDGALILTVLVLATVVLGLTAIAARAELAVILWLVGAFALRNGWFTLFEMGGRGATPGKRLIGLRVVARDGARLTGGAVFARNAMREIEVFLPLSFLGINAAEGTATAFLSVFTALWSGIFLLLPLLNRDRLRVGDIVAGTWVVHTANTRLGGAIDRVPGIHPHRQFTDAALSLYGVYELQTLESALREGQPETLAIIAAAIRRKAGIADDADDRGFLTDYYLALCARLEAGMLVGRHRPDKFGGDRATAARFRG